MTEDYFSRSSSIGGRLFAAQNININDYKIAQQLTAQTAGNSLVAGADIDFSLGHVVFGNILAAGAANIGQTVIDNLHPGAQIFQNAELPINLQQTKEQLKLFSTALSQLPSNSNYSINGQVLQLNPECRAEIQVFQLTANSINHIEKITNSCQDNTKYMLFNVSGDKVNLSDIDASALKVSQQKIIWNLYQAQNIILNNIELPGSLMALDAHIDNDILFNSTFEASTNGSVFDIYGKINGQIMAKSLKANTVISHEPFNCTAQFSVNSTPIVSNQDFETRMDQQLSIQLEVIDESPSTLNYEVTSSVNFGRLLGTFPNVIYIPNQGFSGFDRFIYQVSDQQGQIAIAQVNIKVTNDNLYKNGFEFIQSIVDKSIGSSIALSDVASVSALIDFTPSQLSLMIPLIVALVDLLIDSSEGKLQLALDTTKKNLKFKNISSKASIAALGTLTYMADLILWRRK